MTDHYSVENICIWKMLSITLLRSHDNIINFSNIGLRLVPVNTLLEILEKVVIEQKLETLEIVFFNMLPKGNKDLSIIADTLRDCPNIMEVTTSIDFSLATKLTTLEPLCGAGIFNNLKSISAYGCGLSDKDVLTPELCTMIPSLRELIISSINDTNIIILTADVMCALPPECKIFIYGKNVQVETISSENGEMGLKTLLLTQRKWVNNEYNLVPKTVAEICADAGIVRQTLIKPARA